MVNTNCKRQKSLPKASTFNDIFARLTKELFKMIDVKIHEKEF